MDLLGLLSHIDGEINPDILVDQRPVIYRHKLWMITGS
jgi:hypothetical protein